MINPDACKQFTITGLFISSCLFLGPASATEIFINEIHYDNAGADAGEAIEIAGPAGTDLTGWSVMLMNGNPTQLKKYDTISLSGTIPDQQNSFGTLSFPISPIQNGSPDGLALIDSSNNVVQFLSYEGTFTADNISINGPVAGMTSTDIGVAESSSTPVGFSLQLVGTGREYDDFSWAAASTDTFGTLNNNSVIPTDLFFSEYVEGSSYNKALEIFNGTGASIDLGAEDYTIEIFFNGNTTPGQTIDLSGTIADGDVFVFADQRADGAILAQADQTGGGNYFNGNDAVVLKKGSVVVDSIGRIGEDPGSEWGSGDTSTRDNTMRRLPSILLGDTDPYDPFDPSAEWMGLPLNTFDGLGSHTAESILIRQNIISASVPEPAIHALMGIGLAGVGFARKRMAA